MRARAPISIILAAIVLLVGPDLFARGEIGAGKGSFVFVDEKGDKSKPIKVYYYAPTKLATNSRVVFVLHGMGRSGEVYRDGWARHADKYNFLVLCPEFGERDWPGFWGYYFGNVYNKKRELVEKSKWGYSVIEHLFDYVKECRKMRIESYCIFGHSAGAEFVHRMVIFFPEARISLAIAANAGRYTMPDFEVPLWSGIKDTIVTKKSLKMAFEKNMIIMLGQKDTIPRDESELERKQGRHRLEKGLNFVEFSKAQAESMEAEFNWRSRIIAGAGHNSRKLSEVGSRLISRSRKNPRGKKT